MRSFNVSKEFHKTWMIHNFETIWDGSIFKDCEWPKNHIARTTLFFSTMTIPEQKKDASIKFSLARCASAWTTSRADNLSQQTWSWDQKAWLGKWGFGNAKAAGGQSPCNAGTLWPWNPQHDSSRLHSNSANHHFESLDEPLLTTINHGILLFNH